MTKLPKCAASYKRHLWSRALADVGGCTENPGVWMDGSTLITSDRCVRCRCIKKTTIPMSGAKKVIYLEEPKS